MISKVELLVTFDDGRKLVLNQENEEDLSEEEAESIDKFISEM